MAEDSVAIGAGERRVLLKWHKLRRRAGDPPFSLANLRAGLAAGASLEIDARALADGNWVCLHDDVLDEETSGSGRVDACETTAIAGLHIAGADYAPPLLSQVAAEIAAVPASAARVQIDLKEPRDGLSPQAVARFAEIVTPVAPRCLLSGTDWDAAQTLGASLPALPLGFDPLDMARGRRLDDKADITAFVEEVAATAPSAKVFYVYYRFVLKALDLDINPVARLKERGAAVDVWTIDPETPGIAGILPRVIAAGADQITTNDPPGMARLWRDVGGDSAFAE